MVLRLPGSLLLLLLLVGLLITRPAWAKSNGINSTSVTVRVSPLTLLVQNDVTIKVGEFTCQLFQGADPASVCSDLPPGNYEVSAESDGYIVVPPSYQLTVPGDPQDSDDSDDEDDEENNDDEDDDENDNSDDEDSAAVAQDGTEFFFKFYQNNHQTYMPNLQVQE